MPEPIKQIDHKSAIDLWMSADKLIFFCGSGVSLFSPTGLPTGWKLVQACYQSLEQQFDKAGYPHTNLEDLARLPLETLIGFVIEDMTHPSLAKGLLDIATYFRSIHPNRLHFLVSSFINNRKDCHIITTNYDVGFEDALTAIRKKSRFVKAVRCVEAFGIETLDRIPLDACNLILKIHGCAALDHPENLIITTKQESSGWPRSFLSTLEELFEDSLVVFMGYSLSEPDCLEALLRVSNYRSIWVDRDWGALESNSRAKIILNAAKEAYFLENLIPFIELPWNNINPKLADYYVAGIDDASLRIPFSADRDKQERDGLRLFEDLLSISSEEELFKAAILGYSLLRDFEKVDQYLNQYRKLTSYSRYNYLIWKASIVRDQNSDWEKACSDFQIASNLHSISLLQKALARSLEFGLESLLSQGNNERLRAVEIKLEGLISLANEQLNTCLPKEEQDWLSILGRTQKILVQNLSYQTPQTPDLLKASLSLCEEAIQNLTTSRDIHGRIEAERFRARIYYRIYKTTGNQGDLTEAVEGSRQALRLFQLLGSNMGTVNAKRQYALMLIESRRFDEAELEMRDLRILVDGSQDNLSKMKMRALETYFYFRAQRVFSFLKSLGRFISQSRSLTESQPKWRNLVAGLKWYLSWVRGTAG